MKFHKVRSPLFLALSILFLIIFWVTLMPVQLGGWVTYAIVDGISMEPGFHRGDLILVRNTSAYGVGDAIIYFDPNLGSFVFHRIVGIELDRFVLQGDNNAWQDSYRPTTDEVAGKLWIGIPKLGKAIEWVRTPLNMSLTVGLLGGVLMLDLFKKPSRNKPKASSSLQADGVMQAAILGSTVFTLLFLAFGIYFFFQPLEKPTDNISYQQEGVYYYSATGTPGVYDTDVVQSGEPVFPKLTCFLNIGFTYNLLSDRLQNPAGTYKMTARIMDEQSGWQRTIPLNTNTTFTGGSYFTMATLDLCQVESMVNLVEKEAGLKQIAYTLEIISDVSFTASAEGAQISDSFSPALVFKYDKIHFYLDADESQVDPLRTSKPGLAGSSASQQNTISLLGFAVPVWVMRFVSLLGFGFSALTLAILGMNLYRTASQSEEALARLKHGSMIVDVYEQELAASLSIIDVASLDDLARLAERQGTMILHMPRNFLHFYFVQSNGVTYRYVFSSGKKGIVEEEPAQVQTEPIAEPVEKPAIVSEDTHQDAVEERPFIVGDRVIYTYPPQEAVVETGSQTVSVEKAPLPQTTSQEEEIEYVIDIGAIEFDMPPQDAVFLRRIKI